ncbi:hypothetical protein EW026_g7448 [Hermanssonia centrifuga]|uniref:Protein kinase domain-containing protein n=1 Tax=Hermanssonia centrifuga TaxID=98765 RepID=A0A4S4K7T0_9APHY|nr:hypothetical protein EW026_g7448 [Hermanssonia centrifuga]
MYSKFSGKLALVRSDYLWFTHITQNFAVLKVLHQAGWVHRDISSANILTDSTGRVKLIDLEYAKKADDESRRDMRVGTAKFMSVELDRRYYRYRPSPVVSPLPEAPPFDPLYTPSTPTSGTTQTHTPSIPSTPPPPEPEPPFRYNPIHDFESLWWVTTFFVFQMEAAFKSAAPLSVTIKMPIGGQLETWRAKIIRAYRKAEQTRIPDATMAMQDLHEEFAKDLFRIFDMLAGKTVMTEESWITNESEAANPPQEISSKRKREDQDEHRDEPEAGEPADPARSRKKARKARPVVLVDGPAARTRARLRAKAR